MHNVGLLMTKCHDFNIVADSKQCAIDSPVTVPEGEMADVICQLNFTADKAAVMAWRVSWRHGDQQLPSSNHDTMATVKRVASFQATADNAGEYSCEISSGIKPRFNVTCATTIKVQSEYVLL